MARESAYLRRLESSAVPVPMMRFGSMPESFQISVATTSHGFEMVIHTPSNPASAIGLMNVFAVSVV